jgi:transposase-like protein
LRCSHSELQSAGECERTTRLRQAKCLNNGIENDQKSTKCKSRYRQWDQTFETPGSTMDGMETIRMIQKRQPRCESQDIFAQNKLINKVFGLAA